MAEGVNVRITGKLQRFIEIRHYTDKNWGEKQADKYVCGLSKAIEDAAINKKYQY